MQPLDLDADDKADLIAFLESLTERRRRDMLPELPGRAEQDAALHAAPDEASAPHAR
jgi:hypothetical protein